MYTIDREVVQRQMEDMRQEVEQYRLGQKALKRKRKERKHAPFWTIFFSFTN
jgi:hypothetical protein